MHLLSSPFRRIPITILCLFFLTRIAFAQCAPNTHITVNPSSLPNAPLGLSYAQNLGATGGQAPYTYSVFLGSLPPGLTLNTSGHLSGTPTSTGNYSFTARVRDANGCFGQRIYSINVACPTISLNRSTLPNGIPGAPYSQTIFASGGASPYNFSVLLGSLPPGLSLSSSGTISGTPTSSGTWGFTLRVGDNSNCFLNRAFSIEVGCPTFTINPGSLATGTVGAAYSQNFSAFGGVSPYNYSLLIGNLPPGLTLSGTGAITGTPTAAGSFGFTMRVRDANDCFTFKPYSITIDPGCPPISITPLGLQSASTGVPYTQNLEAGGGGRHTFSIVANSLPPGLTLQSSSGLISGTPTTTGTYGFQVRATDANGCTGLKSYTIVVACGTITVTPGSPLSATIGVPYSQSFTASGTRPPYNFPLITGTLPPGLTLNASGTIAGTPTTAGSYSFSLRVSDGNNCFIDKAYNFTVTCPTITINPPSLPNGTVGATYSQNLTSNGGQGPYEFGIQTGSLPPGLTITSAGTIAGTPTQAGSFSFIARTRDANGCVSSKPLTLVVGCPTITIGTAALPTGVVGEIYPHALTVSGGQPPYEFAIESGALPPGLAMSAAGKFGGTPTRAGSFSFVVRTRDANGCVGSVSVTLVMTCPTLSLAPASGTLPAATVNTPYSQVFTASGGTAPYSYKISAQPNLQSGSGGTNGFSFDSGTGTLSGTPTAAETYAFTIEAIDANLCKTVRAYTLVVNPPVCPTITINPAALSAGTTGVAYNQSFTASGGAGAYSFSLVAGSLPNGLSLTASGALNGTPASTGSFTFTVRATDANGCAGERGYTLVINPPACPTITINPAALPAGTTGAAYNQSFTASGGLAPYAFSVASGALPNGLTLAANGSLSGMSSITGSFAFTVRATDANGCTGERAYLVVLTTNLFTSVSAANFLPNNPLAPESIVAGFGMNLTSTIQAATTLPLPTELAGVSLKVRDSAGAERLAPLFFVSPTQINYLLPAGTAIGPSTVTVTNGGNIVAEGGTEIATVSPGMFSADGSGRGLASALALRIRSNGAQSFEPISRYDAATGRFVPLPIDVSNPADQVYLVFYATGLKLRSALSAVACAVGGVASDVLYAGEVAGFVGYDQVNVRLASTLAGRGEIDVVITVDGKTANTVRIAIQ
ncbi:MAG: putative Ig domain-containing protein [Blastocatellia bacterium]|nr:putative Ig domain-containing protein [Blastocatellia bacterium]